MNEKKWILSFISLTIIITFSIFSLNYIIDPYGIYNNNYIQLDKIKQEDKIRLTKAIKLKDLKPQSICLGSSRAEAGYDPTHSYFLKPSLNLAVPGGSIYESYLYLKNSINQGNLKKVLLVADHIMFHSKQREVDDIEEYFKDNPYQHFFSIDMFKDSLLTLKGTNSLYVKYLNNGQRVHNYNQKRIDKYGGHLKLMNKNESIYYKNRTTDYKYYDTKNDSFQDFINIIHLCYQNNIELDIIFGPSHIRQWEAFNYYHNINKWLQWKKDIVITVNKISKVYDKKPFRVFDFSVYHKLTSETVPTDSNINMTYFWEGSHYKNALGQIVLDRLDGKSYFNDFGKELNIDNIQQHIYQLQIDREKYIDTKLYRKNFKQYLHNLN